MTIICPYCSSEIQIKDYDAHALAAHPEETERRALLSIETAQAQVEYIYNHHPETKQDNGLLIFHFAQGYPKLALQEEAQSYTISAKYASFVLIGDLSACDWIIASPVSPGLLMWRPSRVMLLARLRK